MPDPEPADGWVRVMVHAASLNHHDLWSLWRTAYRMLTTRSGLTSGETVLVHRARSRLHARAGQRHPRHRWLGATVGE